MDSSGSASAQCSGGAGVDVKDQSGNVTGKCFSNGDRKYVCKLHEDMCRPWGLKRMTRDEIECNTPIGAMVEEHAARANATTAPTKTGPSVASAPSNPAPAPPSLPTRPHCKITHSDQGILSVHHGARTAPIYCDGFTPDSDVEVTLVGEVVADRMNSDATVWADLALESSPNACHFPQRYADAPPCLAHTGGGSKKVPWSVRMMTTTKSDEHGRAQVTIYAFRCTGNGDTYCNISPYTITMTQR